MSIPLPAALLLLLIPGSVFAADRGSPILFKIEPAAADSQVGLPPIPILPAPPAFPNRLEMPSLAPSLFTYPVLDTLATGPRPFEFKEYWAQVEKAHGIDELRMRMGMLNSDSRTPGAFPEASGPSGLDNQLGLAILLFRAWKSYDEKADRERRFRMRVEGLIDLASRLRLEDHRGAAPGLSLIVAKLDFMGKRVKGRLPDRPERRMFTENLKAWAANPVLDSTGLGPALMEVCRLYEEYER